MKKVLLTGASGLIGRQTIATLINHGFEVHAVTTKPTSVVISRDCSWHITNLLNTPEIEPLLVKVQPTHLMHFAWYTVPGKYWAALDNLSWVQTSLELLRQFQAQGGTRVVMAGSCAEYNWSYGYCSESLTPRVPSSPYGTCKNALQEMLAAYSKSAGLSSAWGRIFLLYGFHEHPNRLVPSVIHALLSGEPALCSHGHQIRDFLHVQDVADAFVALLESDVTGAVNIASGQPVQIKQIIQTIAEKIGSPELVRLGAVPVSDQEQQFLVANVDRLTKEVQWLPKYDLDRGLEQTITWWKNHLMREAP